MITDKEKQKHNRLTQLSTLILAFLAFAVVVVFYLAVIDANPPIEVNSIKITPETTFPGDTVIMSNDYCKYTDAGSHLTAFWQRDDGLIWEVTIRDLSMSEAGCFSINIPLTIPGDIPDGRWRRVNTGTYQVNAISSRTETWRSEFIEIR